MAAVMFGRGVPVGRRAPAGTLYSDTTGGPLWMSVEDPIGTQRWRPIGIEAFGRFEHFRPDAGATLPAPLGTQDTSAAGSPTLNYVADADGGTYKLALATDNEVEAITLYDADQLTMDIDKRPVFGIRLKVQPDVTGAGGTFAAGDKFAFGLGSARNATLDNMTLNAWFLLAGANLNVYWETDDGTTDDDDNDSGVDYVDDTFLECWVAVESDNKAHFYINGAEVGQGSLAAASGNVQVFLELAKAAAANKDHTVTIDWICAFSRS